MKSYPQVIQWTVRVNGTGRVVGVVNAKDDIVALRKAREENPGLDVRVDDSQYLDNVTTGTGNI
jgi:hypothetical protein